MQWLHYFIFIITDPSKPAAQESEGGERERGIGGGERERERRGAGVLVGGERGQVARQPRDHARRCVVLSSACVL